MALDEKKKHLDFTIIVHGVSAHGSTPHLGKDAIVAASAIIQAAQTLVSRVNDPLRPLVLGFEAVKAGHQFNIVCDEVKVNGSLFAYDEEYIFDMAQKLKQLAQKTAEAFACNADLILAQ